MVTEAIHRIFGDGAITVFVVHYYYYIFIHDSYEMESVLKLLTQCKKEKPVAKYSK